MSFLRAWRRESLYESLHAVVATATGSVTARPTLLYYSLFTHRGTSTGSGGDARIDLLDGGASGERRLHVELEANSRTPFALSICKPVLYEQGLFLAFTATGLRASFGFYAYEA